MSANFNELEVLCNEENFEFVCLSETHLTENISDGEISIKNYNLFRCDSHSRHTGGVCIYIKNDWKIKIIESSAVNEIIWFLKIEIKKRKDIYFGQHL